MNVADSGAWATAHNFYISWLNDFGLMGLVLFIVPVFWGLLKAGGQVILRHGRQGSSSAFCFVSLAGLLIHNLSETFFYSPTLMFFVFFLLALVSGEEVKRGV